MGGSHTSDEPSQQREDQMMRVYLDGTSIPLECEGVKAERWNGYARPLATAKQMSDFLHEWRKAEPDNPTWGYVVRHDGRLYVTRLDSDDVGEWDYFSRHGVTDDGLTLWDLSGWVWVEAEGTSGVSR